MKKSINILNKQINYQILNHKIHFILNDEVDIKTISLLSSEIKKIITEISAISEIEFDISNFTYIDSLMLGELMRIKKRLQNENIKFRLINPSAKVKFIIESASFEPFLLEGENW